MAKAVSFHWFLEYIHRKKHRSIQYRRHHRKQHSFIQMSELCSIGVGIMLKLGLNDGACELKTIDPNMKPIQFNSIQINTFLIHIFYTVRKWIYTIMMLGVSSSFGAGKVSILVWSTLRVQTPSSFLVPYSKELILSQEPSRTKHPWHENIMCVKGSYIQHSQTSIIDTWNE